MVAIQVRARQIPAIAALSTGTSAAAHPLDPAALPGAPLQFLVPVIDAPAMCELFAALRVEAPANAVLATAATQAAFAQRAAILALVTAPITLGEPDRPCWSSSAGARTRARTRSPPRCAGLASNAAVRLSSALTRAGTDAADNRRATRGIRDQAAGPDLALAPLA